MTGRRAASTAAAGSITASRASSTPRGKVAINISQGNEEEGASHKPFQIAASGVAQVHIDRKGLSDYFEPHREIELFETPAQARRVIAELLADDDRRIAMGAAARQRLLREHTWGRGACRRCSSWPVCNGTFPFTGKLLRLPRPSPQRDYHSGTRLRGCPTRSGWGILAQLPAAA